METASTILYTYEPVMPVSLMTVQLYLTYTCASSLRCTRNSYREQLGSGFVNNDKKQDEEVLTFQLYYLVA